jgi:hypothetical protein
VIVPTSSVAAVRLRGSIEVAYEDQMSAPDLVPGRCGLRAGIATAGARCFGLRGGSEMLSCVASLMQTTSRRLSSAEVDKLSLGRGAEAAECRIGLRDGTNSSVSPAPTLSTAPTCEQESHSDWSGTR